MNLDEKDNYIVKIYNRDAEIGRLVGVVEDVQGKRRRLFQAPEHLLSFLWEYAPCDRRLCGRLHLRLPVQVKGVNTDGRVFAEDTTIKDISTRGAYLFLKNRMSEDDELRLLIDPDNSALDVRARIARVEAATRPSIGVGVRFELKGL
ncbi:MAG: PilZ domain-containing protein [Nitrospirota bacterium]|jgi:hypothetical protein